MKLHSNSNEKQLTIIKWNPELHITTMLLKYWTKILLVHTPSIFLINLKRNTFCYVEKN